MGKARHSLWRLASYWYLVLFFVVTSGALCQEQARFKSRYYYYLGTLGIKGPTLKQGFSTIGKPRRIYKRGRGC